MSGLAVIVAAGDLVQLRRQRVLRAVWGLSIAAPAIAAVVTSLLLPWIGGGEAGTSLPASAIARFFGDSFERRTNRPLQAVAGDPRIATLIGMASQRPHVFPDATPQRTPWINQAKFNEVGGVVVWRASDTVGTPPPDIAARFPGIVPELPRAFDRTVSGRSGPVADRMGHRAAERCKIAAAQKKRPGASAWPFFQFCDADQALMNSLAIESTFSLLNGLIEGTAEVVHRHVVSLQVFGQFQEIDSALGEVRLTVIDCLSSLGQVTARVC